jgi:putative tricarboxylic transport membrane protein
MFRHADRLAGGAISLGGIALLAGTRLIEINELQSDLTARFFPTLLAAGLVLSGMVIFLKPGILTTGTAIAGIVNRRAMLTALLFLAYCLGFPYMDFRLGAFAFTLAAMLVLGARRPLELVLVPVLVSGAVYSIFRFGFSVLLPTWI